MAHIETWFNQAAGRSVVLNVNDDGEIPVPRDFLAGLLTDAGFEAGGPDIDSIMLDFVAGKRRGDDVEQLLRDSWSRLGFDPDVIGRFIEAFRG